LSIFSQKLRNLIFFYSYFNFLFLAIRHLWPFFHPFRISHENNRLIKKNPIIY